MFHEGERVLIRDDLIVNRVYGSASFVVPMSRYLGKVVTVSSKNAEDLFHIEEDGGRYWYTEDMVAGYAEDEIVEIKAKELFAMLGID